MAGFDDEVSSKGHSLRRVITLEDDIEHSTGLAVSTCNVPQVKKRLMVLPVEPS